MQRPHPGALHHFTPHHHLAALVNAPGRLDLSPGARTVLGVALWRAGRTGEGEGTREGEAMFVRRIASSNPARDGETLRADARMSKWAVRCALRELTRAGLLRAVVYRPLERLPRFPGGRGGGRRVDEGTILALYVDIVALRTLLDGGIGCAKKSVPQTSRSLVESPVTPRFSAEFGAPLTKTAVEVACDHLWLTKILNHKPQRNTAPPPPGGGGFSTVPREQVDELFGYWWSRIGRRRSGLEQPTPGIVRAVTGAIARALTHPAEPPSEPYTPERLRRAIDARADEAIGGKAYRFCERPDRHPDRPIWQAGMFTVGGALDHLIAEAQLSETRARRAEARALASDRRAGGPPEPSDPSARQRAVQAVSKDLAALIGINPEPAWLKGREDPTWQPDEARAAFRPKR